MDIFLKRQWLIPNILKWQDFKIFTKLAPLQTPSRGSHQRCSVKKGTLKICEILQENTCGGVSLIKLQTFRPTKKASQKLHVLAGIVNYMELSRRESLMKAFVTSQFNCCPLTWMFHSRELNNRINRIRERALRWVYQDNCLSFAELREKDNSRTIHQRNLQVLAMEILS